MNRNFLRLPVGAYVALTAMAMLATGHRNTYGQKTYIEISRPQVNVRAAAGTSSALVVKARGGDVFELEGETGRWYIIHMFSGDSRYVHKSLAKEARYSPLAPEDAGARREIFQAWLEAEKKVEEEADRRYSPDQNLEKNIEFGRILSDRYKLEVIHRFKIQPPLYRRIAIEGFQKGW